MKPRTYGMLSSRDDRVDVYIAQAAVFAHPILIHLRKLVHASCSDTVETIKWGMPHFTHSGNLCGIAAFKTHCAFVFSHERMESIVKDGNTLQGEAMGNLGRITSLESLPSDLVMKRYLKAAVALNDSGIRSMTKRKPKPELEVPADLAAALRAHVKADKMYKSFPPGARRDYVEWITEAKRPETRAKRLATTIEWLGEGKKRNWKYANC